MPKQCFLLGAGFSVALGLPLANQLNLGFLDDEQCANPLLDPEHHAHLKLILGDGYAQRDLESLFAALREDEEYRQDCEQQLNEENPIEKDVSKADIIRWRVLARLARTLHARERAADSDRRTPYTRFVHYLFRSNSSVVSFNWDLVLENACATAQIPWHYGWDGAETGVVICKPHGSINLAKIKANQREFLDYPGSLQLWKVVRKDGVEVSLALQTLKPSLTITQVVHINVEPAFSKPYDNPWIKKQWCMAWAQIRAADEIVVLGYRFPETDVRSQLLIRYAVHEGKRITVVDPTVEDHFVVKEQLPRVQAIRIKWEEWGIFE